MHHSLDRDEDVKWELHRCERSGSEHVSFSCAGSNYAKEMRISKHKKCRERKKTDKSLFITSVKQYLKVYGMGRIHWKDKSQSQLTVGERLGVQPGKVSQGKHTENLVADKHNLCVYSFFGWRLVRETLFLKDCVVAEMCSFSKCLEAEIPESLGTNQRLYIKMDDMTAPPKWSPNVSIATRWPAAVWVINPATSMLVDGTWFLSFYVILITLMFVQVLFFW